MVEAIMKPLRSLVGTVIKGEPKAKQIEPELLPIQMFPICRVCS